MNGKWILIGIVNGGISCDTEFPNVFQRITHHLSWIKNKIQNN
jgi:hypothetical protein